MHHFHGTYWATIILVFSDKESARDAKMVFGDNWTHEMENLIFSHGEPELTTALDLLEKFGASKEDVTSCKKSIDYGLPFEIDVPVIPFEQESFPFVYDDH